MQSIGCKGTIMNRGLLAPLSLREISQLLHLLQGKDFEPDPTVFKRFVMLGLVEEKPNGFTITELGRQRLRRA
jgi:hypothetical protein